ncbi:hypothetical protein FA13DRAFT_1801983 [Coprinellus micaceus]|uniref:DUF1996 domain-containing protein n=1 Tax=Coprinellus micaceus TaxID=71717 RepID=A0A4Y7SE48_COPMI|nr:hypothetical protein FA13DRAFT_1801983 [Coprinellus micaceus]
MFGTDCPASHPVRIPLIFMETVWDTKPFNDPGLWPEGGSQPLVWSMGDPTGYGHHADYVFGWEAGSLARALESTSCLSGIPRNCDKLTLQTDDEINKCTQRVRVPELTEGQYLEKLPGCNPLQAGPEPATIVPNCDAVSTTIGTPQPTQGVMGVVHQDVPGSISLLALDAIPRCSASAPASLATAPDNVVDDSYFTASFVA